MSDGHVLTDLDGIGVGDVEDAAVLDIRPLPHPYRVDVAPQYGIEPDARILADLHLADQTRTCRTNAEGCTRGVTP